MTYNWNLDKARKQLDFLKGKLQTAQGNELEDIKDAIFYLKFLIEQKNMTALNDLPNEPDDIKQNFNPYARIVSKASITTGDAPFYTLKYSSTNRSEDEVMDLVHSFYNSLNKKWYNLFLKIFKERQHNIRFTEADTGPIMYHIPYLEYFYLSFRKTGDVREECDAVHEYGHAISNLINPRADSVYYKQILLEVPSLFMELISNDFFKKSSPFPAEYDIHQKNIFDTMLIYFDEVYNNYGYLFENDFVPQEREFLLVTNYAENKLDRFKYAISYLIAIELLHIYYEDKEKAIYYLDEIIQMQDEECILTKLAAMNIHPGANLKKYQNKLVKKIKKSGAIQDSEDI